ncbi:terpene synthase family protein [Streptomyces sp. CRN 30]|uniref:terpene synthase family protein n=1 Tax=Streptomyces sp. CRN 30 TaxID=3075613 RepID=UPI002A7F9802|nr:hypothetical protein [Streptomyces sp. CRN 30]
MKITIPAFYCPIPSRLCPLTEQADKRSLEWIERHRAYRDEAHWNNLTRTRAGFLAGYTVPDGSGEGFQIYSDFLYWLHTFDDTFCDEQTDDRRSPVRLDFLTLQLLRILEAPRTRILTGHPWAQSLRDIRQRLDTCATPTQISRWKSEMAGYFLGITGEAGNRAAAAPVSMADYLLTVFYTGAMQPAFMLTDVACGYEVPDEVVTSPHVRALADLAGLIVECDNDITSYGKETYRSSRYGFPAPQNMVAVLLNERCRGETDALEAAASFRDGLMSLFLTLSEQHTRCSDTSSTAEVYTAGLGQWIRGYLDYARTSDRFLKPANSGDPEGPVIEWPKPWTDAPRETPAFLSVPFASWWRSQVKEGKAA